MPMKQIDGYEIEYMAEPLEGCAQWGAFVAIYAPSATPMHMNIIYPKHRVAADQALASEADAERAAEASALEILEHLRNPPPSGP
ncbi:MAG: hypothetical protein ABW069_15535 [Duganella sp.]